LTTANNLALSLGNQGKHAEAAELLETVLTAQQRVLGAAHPHALSTAQSLETALSLVNAKVGTRKATARRKERVTAAPASPTALAKAEARAQAAEAELLAMLELEEVEAKPTGSGKAKGKRNGRRG
jgi:hypothetical protein